MAKRRQRIVFCPTIARGAEALEGRRRMMEGFVHKITRAVRLVATEAACAGYFELEAENL